MSKNYYIVYATPTQFVPQYYTGEYPLLPKIYDKLISELATKISIATKTITPKEAIQILNVIELPENFNKE